MRLLTRAASTGGAFALRRARAARHRMSGASAWAPSVSRTPPGRRSCSKPGGRSRQRSGHRRSRRQGPPRPWPQLRPGGQDPAVAAGLNASTGTGVHALRHYYACLLTRFGESVTTVQAPSVTPQPRRPSTPIATCGGPTPTTAPARRSTQRCGGRSRRRVSPSGQLDVRHHGSPRPERDQTSCGLFGLSRHRCGSSGRAFVR